MNLGDDAWRPMTLTAIRFQCAQSRICASVLWFFLREVSDRIGCRANVLTLDLQDEALASSGASVACWALSCHGRSVGYALEEWQSVFTGQVNELLSCLAGVRCARGPAAPRHNVLVLHR